MFIINTKVLQPAQKLAARFNFNQILKQYTIRFQLNADENKISHLNLNDTKTLEKNRMLEITEL